MLDELFGERWYERQGINEATRQLAHDDETPAALRGDIEQLFTLDRQQGVELARLYTIIDVLLEFEVGSNRKRSRMIKRRILERLASAGLEVLPQAGAESPDQGHPYRGGTESAAAPRIDLMQCVRCGQKVPQRRTMYSTVGLLCDSCYNLVEG